MKKLAAACVLLALGACATTQSIDQRIVAADRAVTLVLISTDDALNAHLITAAQAQTVSTIAHQVDPLLNAARAASAQNNQAAADSTMNLVNTLLAGLKAYVPPAKSP